LHVDFDDEHQVWHLVVPPPPTTANERTIAVSEKRRGSQLERPRALERSSSSSEPHSSGSHTAEGTTGGSSGNRGLVKTADSNCRTAGDAGSSEVHGGLQQPAGDGGRVDECTPAQKGLP
ncbi:unnamed protein product, partial [Laminaria digitata]